MALYKKTKLSEKTRRKRPDKINPPVFSYYSRGGAENSENIGRRGEPTLNNNKITPKLGHVPSYIAIIVIIVALGYSFVLQPETKIILVNDSNTVHREPKIYKNVIQSTMERSILNRSKVTINISKLEKEIQAQFPELAKVEIELPLLGRRPTVVLTPVEPAMEFISVNGVFYVDKNGKVMARTSELQKNELKNLPIIRDDSGLTADPGKNIIPSFEAEFLSDLYAHLSEGKISIESITLSGNTANEIDVRVTGQTYFVKFTVDSDPRQAVGTYLALKSKLDVEGITPAEYVDVRVEEKVFYK